MDRKTPDLCFRVAHWMMSEVAEFLNQHPGVRDRIALVGLFHGYVSTPILAGISARSAPQGPAPPLNEKMWSEALQPLHQAGLLEQAQENSAYIPLATGEFLHALLVESHQARLPEYQRAFAETYGLLARELVTRYSADPSHALFFLRPEEQNLVQALQLAGQFSLWPVLHDLLLALEKLFVPAGHWKEWAWLLNHLPALPDISPPSADPAALGLHQTVLRCRAALARQHQDGRGEIQLLSEHADLARRQHDSRLTADALHLLGEAALRHHRFEQAEQSLQESLTTYCRQNDKGGEAKTAFLLAQVCRGKGESAAALPWLQSSVHAAQSSGHADLECRALQQLGELAAHSGALTDACHHFRQWLKIRESSNDAAGQATALEALGNLALQQKQPEEAEHWFRRSAQIWRQVGDIKNEAKVYLRLGDALLTERALDRAEVLYREALHLQVRLADNAGQADALCRMGRLALQRNNFSQARQWLSQSADLLDVAAAPELRADVFDTLGTLAYLENGFDEAEVHYQQSLAIRQRLSPNQEHATVLYHLGLVAERRKDLPAARTRHESCLELATRLNDPGAQLQSLLQLASIGLAQGNLQEADRRCREALILAEGAQSPRDVAEIYYRLGRIAHERCQNEEALERYRLSLAIYRDLADLENYSKVLGHLATVPGVDPALLIECYRHGLSLADRSSDTDAQLKLLYRLAALAETNDHWLDAEQWYRRCLSVEQAVGSKVQQAYLLQKLGLILERQGRPAEAILHFQRSVQLAGFPNGDHPFHTTVMEHLGGAALQKQEYEEAFVYFQHASKLALESGDGPAAVHAALGLGRVAMVRGATENAGSWFEQALSTAHENGNQRLETAALIALGDLARQGQQWKDAERRYTLALKNLQTVSDSAIHATTLVGLAEVNEELGRPKKAAQFLTQALSLFESLQDAVSVYRTRTALQRLRP